VITRDDSDRHSTVLVAADPPPRHPQWLVEPVSFEQLVLAYLRRRPAPVLVPAQKAEVR
jgi:hypothetical protein